MKKYLLLVLAVMLGTVVLSAAKYNYNFKSVSIAEALRKVSADHPDLIVNFIYDDLENYRTTAVVATDDAATALRRIIGGNPVSLVSSRGVFYVEARHRSRKSITGRVRAADGNPLRGASVYILAPKDSAVLTFGVTDEAGRFSIPCDRKQVIVKTVALGFYPLSRRISSFAAGEFSLTERPTQLAAVTVNSDREYIDGDKTVFLPTKREKNAAQGGAELLMFMSMPGIDVNPLNKTITTAAGAGVATYIDYVEASATDLKNLNPKDVAKVEVFDHPSDPRFKGAPHVVNFVLVKYEYGGYTKLRGQQTICETAGNYGVNSRFTYKKMTYDVAAGADFSYRRHSGRNSEDVFEFDDYTLHRSQRTLSSLRKYDSEFVSFRANYVADKTVISNTAGLGFSHNPGSYSETMTEYSSHYQSGVASEYTSYRSLSPYWRGEFQFSLPRDMMLVVSPKADYSRNHSKRTYSSVAGDNCSDVVESAWYTLISTKLNKRWGKQSVGIAVNGEFQGNSLDYAGTSPSSVDYSQNAIGVFIDANLRFGNFYIRPSAKYYFSHTSFGGSSYYEHLPGYYVYASWNPSRRHSVSLSSEMSNWTIGVNQRSPNIVVQNPVLAVQGNPDLKSYLYNSVNLSYNWIASQKISLSANASFRNFHKPIDASYSPTEIDGRQMMLCTYVRDGNFSTTQLRLSATFRLLDNSLILKGNISENFSRRTGINRFSGNYLRSSLQAYYYFGDFYVGAYYSFPYRDIYISDYYYRTPANYVLMAGWSFKGLNLGFTAANLFNSSWLQYESSSEYQRFRENTTTFGSGYHRSFTFSATYTFGYGKRLDRDNELGRDSTVESGIVQ